MAEVPRRRTPATLSELGAALVTAHVRQFGGLPTRRRATLILSQWALETGQGRSIFNNNVGNLTANDASANDFWRPPWFEPPPYDEADTSGFGSNASKRLETLHERMLEGNAPRAFRSYPTLPDGASSYMALLKQKRFAPLLSAADSGSPRQFATAVFETKYCPDPECHPDKTTGSFTSLQKQINREGIFADLPSSGAERMGLALVLLPLAAWGAYAWLK